MVKKYVYCWQKLKMNNRMNKKCTRSCESTIASLKKSNSLMKSVNKEMVLNMQRLKENLSKSSAHNASLKAELYDIILERNSLLDKNIKLTELLRTLHLENLSMGKRIEDTLNPRDAERDRLATKQSAIICPMVSGHVIHNPKVELRRLDYSDFPDASNVRGNDAIHLSPVVEEPFMEIEENENATETGRNSTESGRNSTALLTINLMSPQNDLMSSSGPVNPSVFVNVFPRKQKYSKKTSVNGFTLGEMGNENQDPQCTRIIDFKQPIILLERYPLLSERTLNASTVGDNEERNSDEEKPNIFLSEPINGQTIENEKKSELSQLRSPVVKSEENGDFIVTRRSARIRKRLYHKQ